MQGSNLLLRQESLMELHIRELAQRRIDSVKILAMTIDRKRQVCKARTLRQRHDGLRRDVIGILLIIKGLDGKKSQPVVRRFGMISEELPVDEVVDDRIAGPFHRIAVVSEDFLCEMFGNENKVDVLLLGGRKDFPPELHALIAFRLGLFLLSFRLIVVGTSLPRLDVTAMTPDQEPPRTKIRLQCLPHCPVHEMDADSRIRAALQSRGEERAAPRHDVDTAELAE